MNQHADFTKFFIIETNTSKYRYAKNFGGGRCVAIHMSPTAHRWPGKFLFYPGYKPFDSLNRSRLSDIFKPPVKNHIWRKITTALRSFFRIPEFLAWRPDSDSEAARIRPLKSGSMTGRWISKIGKKGFVKPAKSDAEVVLEMKRNPLTSVYEVNRIIAADR